MTPPASPPAAPEAPVPAIPLQSASLDIWRKKYRLTDPSGAAVDADPEATLDRVARTLADVEARDDLRRHWHERFLWAMRQGALPAGRILSNAGAGACKPATSTINCTVANTLGDSMDAILTGVHEAGMTLRAGCGIGYEFSTLRPRGAFVVGAGASTSGPVSFMDIFDKMCFTVASAGNRRGAQMGTFDISHPDVREFIRAKREDGRLRQFNLSLLITDGFMQAVEADGEWPLVFPVHPKDVGAVDLEDATQVVWRSWPTSEGCIVREDGLVACRIHDRIRARRLWDMIMTSTYDYAEPGLILIDRVNEMNNNWWCENIRATNPCVTADTWVQTAAGPRQVSDLLGHGFVARVDGHDHATGAEGFFRTATKPVLVLQTKEGYRLRLTEDHLLRRVSRLTRLSMDTEWCAAGALRPGDRVLLNDHRANSQWPGALTAEQGYLLGMLVGDGVLKHKRAVLSVWPQAAIVNGSVNVGGCALMAEVLRCAQALPHRADFAGWSKVAGRGEFRMGSAALRNLAFEFGMSVGDKAITPALERASSEGCRAFLRGFFDADGSVQGSQAVGGVSVRLAQSDLPRLEAVQRMLLRLGIPSRIYRDRRIAGERYLPDGHGGMRAYATKSQHELIVFAGESLQRFADLIGFADANKAARLKAALSGYKRMPSRARFVATVASLRADGVEDVYDVQVPGIHTFDGNGLHVHNCGEQALPPYGSCWTGAMRLNTNYGLVRTDDAFALAEAGRPLMIGVDDLFSRNKTDLRPCTLVRNGEKEVFDVRFANGQRIELTADHRVRTPSGWKEVRDLEAGSEVHVQSRELSTLPLLDDFDLGALHYVLSRHEGEEIVVTHATRRAFVRPLLDRLRINYRERANGLFVSRHHTAIREVERLDVANASKDVLRGYVHAATTTAAHDKGKPCAYGDAASMQLLADACARLGGIRPRVTRHKGDTYRVLLDTSIYASSLRGANRSLDLDFALFGWILADGGFANSAGVLFADRDDVAMRLLAPRLEALTGTHGGQRRGSIGSSTDVPAIVCLKKDVVKTLRSSLGLPDDAPKALRVPEKVFCADMAQQASFLASVFCADGSIDNDKLAIRLTSASRGWLEDIQLLLLNFGIHGMIHAAVSKGNAFYSLLLRPSDAYRYFRHIGFPFCTGKQERLERHLVDKQRWHEPEDHAVETVVSIESRGVQPVYDIEEFSTNTLIVNGVVVHNCLLGSVNLTRFVREPFTPQACFDWDTYREVVRVFTRMLDNVVEINGLPLARQREEILRKRRHGMGFLGLGSALCMLGVRYGSAESCAFTEQAAREMALTGWDEGVALAREKGPAPIFEETVTLTPELMRLRPDMARDGLAVGDRVPARVLHARYSRYMQRLAAVRPDLIEAIAHEGCRFTHHTSVAPTGTIALSFGNNASNGIEPSFAHAYVRNVIHEGKKTKAQVEVASFELLAYRMLVNPKADPGGTGGAALPDSFVAADQITPREHVDVQAAAQKWVDSSISKTANVPTDYPYDSFKDIYRYAYQSGLKGCTTFRFNPAAFSGVLVRQQDLANTTYRFTFADGGAVEVKGNETILYDGETHTAANLFDALKEGYYGRF